MEIPGFAVGERVGGTDAAPVYAATLVKGDKAATLAVAPAAAARKLPWPEHPQLVALYGSGTYGNQAWVATQRVTGTTLGARRPPRRRRVGLLRAVGAALDAIHEAGGYHGGVGPDAVVIDAAGMPWLTGPTLGPGSAEEDRAAFAALTDTVVRQPQRRLQYTITFVAVVLVGLEFILTR